MSEPLLALSDIRAGYGSAMAVAIIFLCSLLLVRALSVRRRSEGPA